MSNRKRGRKAPPIPSPPSRDATETAAAIALDRQRQHRAGRCLDLIREVLAQHACTLQVVTQEIQNPGEAAVSRICQVNVIALDAPAAPDSAPPAKEDGAA